MTIEETTLTPELASQLLATDFAQQRRWARQTVAKYERDIREGRWRLVPDCVMVVGPTYADEAHPVGAMFNGQQRCRAVVAAHRAIQVYIDWDADWSLFDVIDTGRPRTASQFLHTTYAPARASAARLTLWYARRFERPPEGVNIAFSLHEIMQEEEGRTEAFDRWAGRASATYEYTGLSAGVCLAAYSLAADMGLDDEVLAFIDGVQDPLGLSNDDPARLLAERFRKQSNRARRRSSTEDWTILVRALNLHLEGRTAARLQMNSVWPRVGESEREYRKRVAAQQTARNRKEHAAVPYTKSA